MRLALLADFWPWYNALPNSEKIAYWSMLVSVVTAFSGVIVGIVAARHGAKKGAEAAFELGRKQQKQDLEDKQYSALVAAKYTLAGQWNILEGYRIRQMEPRRDKPNRHLTFPRYYAPNTALHIAVNDLAFIVQTEDANLLLEIDIAQQRYLSSLVVIDRVTQEIIARDNNPHVEQMEFNSDTGGGKIKTAERELYYLKASVNALYDILDKTIPGHLKTIAEIEAYIEKHYKRQSFKLVLQTEQPKQTAPVANEGEQHQQSEA